MRTSGLCSLPELDRMRDQWMRAFTPISNRQLTLWQRDWSDALRTLPYLRLVKVESGGFFSMLELRCAMNVSGLNLDMVQADLDRLWAGDISAGLHSGHTFRRMEKGFEMAFAALTTDTHYITGSILVARKEG